MSTERSYRCNICDSNHTSAQTVVGLRLFDIGIEKVNAFETDTHLCRKCYMHLGQLWLVDEHKRRNALD